MIIPATVPLRFTAGDFLTWRIGYSDYPASQGWGLSYALVNSAAKITFSATATGDDFLVAVPMATTAAYAAGVYQWQAYASNGTQRFTVASGEITIDANLAGATTLDTRSQAKRILDAVEAVLEGRASSDQQKYAIAGRSLERTPIPDLIKLRDKYAAIYKSEQSAEAVANGKFGKNRILVRI